MAVGVEGQGEDDGDDDEEEATEFGVFDGKESKEGENERGNKVHEESNEQFGKGVTFGEDIESKEANEENEDNS